MSTSSDSITDEGEHGRISFSKSTHHSKSQGSMEPDDSNVRVPLSSPENLAVGAVGGALVSYTGTTSRNREYRRASILANS